MSSSQTDTLGTGIGSTMSQCISGCDCTMSGSQTDTLGTSLGGPMSQCSWLRLYNVRQPDDTLGTGIGSTMSNVSVWLRLYNVKQPDNETSRHLASVARESHCISG